MEACETFPGRLPIIFQGQLINQFKRVDPSTDQTSNAGAISFLRSWQKIVHAYMECDLTYTSDKIIALSGVAEEFQSISNDVYLAGLWKNCFFIEQFLWSVMHNKQVNGQPSARPSFYRAPSWSWLSIDAKLSFPLIFEPSFVEIQEANVELVNDNNPTGQVKQGTVSIRGQLKRTNFQKKASKRSDFYIYDEGNNRMGLMTVNFDEAAIKPTQAFCMPVRFCWDDTLEGLILLPTGEKYMEFKRLGHFKSDDFETHEKLARGRNEDKVNFTIV
ncbi:hypothetical protein MMC28_008647 [Mycoblastus sanguinarius]|nr:hypothetical protein [Mycoblastus sanguinarius]